MVRRIPRLFALLFALCLPAVPSAASGERPAEPFVPSTEFSWFADAAFRVRDGAAETRGFEFVQTELGMAHRLHPRLALEAAVGYDHAGKTGFIPKAYLDATLFRTGRWAGEWLVGVFDVPLGADYRYYEPQDRWLFTDPMSSELTWARWNDAGHQFNLRHGNFKL